MTQKQAVLRLLSDHKPHTHRELYALGCVAHSRVSDLRADGHTIDQWREGDRYLYLLKPVTLEEPAHPAGELDAVAPVSLHAGSSSVPAAAADTQTHTPSREPVGTLTLFGDAA